MMQQHMLMVMLDCGNAVAALLTERRSHPGRGTCHAMSPALPVLLIRLGQAVGPEATKLPCGELMGDGPFKASARQAEDVVAAAGVVGRRIEGSGACLPRGTQRPRKMENGGGEGWASE